jgi:hypothetical protein
MENEKSKFSKAVCWAGIAVLAVAMAAPVVHAKPKPKLMLGQDGGKMILVSPAELPELARQSGEAMLLHETGDGRTFLYLEQGHGARLAIFDVSDPGDIKARGAVRLEATGAFDFVAAAGDRAEILRFREGQGEAWLDLRKFKSPVIRTGPSPKLPRAAARVDADGNILAAPASPSSPQAHTLEETANAPDTDRAVDVNNILEQLTNGDTGTTFLLTADGLHVIRRPAVEREYAAHQDQLSNPG